MTKTHNQFILMNLEAFTEWMFNAKVSRPVTRIQNHHTWKPDYENFRGDNHFNLLGAMKRHHLSRGFSDIAQNLTTFPDGTIAVCRPFQKTPAGIKGANTGSLCIEHVGNFNIGGDTMRKEHRSTIIYLNALLCQRFELTPNTDTLIYHHWWDLKTGKRTNGEGTTKSCPGTNFFCGNKVWDAEAYFIPPVKEKLDAITKKRITP